MKNLVLIAVFLPLLAVAVPKPIYEKELGFVELYDKAWELARQHVHETKGMPSERYMDEAFWDSDIWIWDSCFMALYCKYAPQEFPGIETLDNFYSLLLQDGRFKLVMVKCDNPWAKEKLGDPTPLSVHIPDNPPLMAWAELSYAKYTGDRARLERILKTERQLPRYYDFVENFKKGWWVPGVRTPVRAWRTENGFHWAGGQSGMDNTPRGREGLTSAKDRPENPALLWVDLLAQQALAADSIACAFDLLGDSSVAADWRKKRDEKNALLNRLYWQCEDGFYYDILEPSLKPCKVMTVASYWAMMCGAASERQAKRMCEKLRFGGELSVTAGVPSLSTKDADFHPTGKYWRGGMWPPTSYMIVKALEKYGEFDLAREIALKTIRHQLATYREYDPHTIWEAYAPNRPVPATHPDGKTRVTPDFCGWSALGPVSMLLEDVIGLYDANAFTRELFWRLPPREEGRVGVRDYRFGDIVCDLMCEGDTVTVKSSGAFTLWLDGHRCLVRTGDNVFASARVLPERNGSGKDAPIGNAAAFARPVPSAALTERLRAEEDVIGIVHWGLNTYTDREWGYGDENPKDLNPAKFDADQICRACADGGLKGLVVVAKHHDGFCLWPTKTTEHNITKSPFRGGKGDYVCEMANACRKAGMKFGVYVSPWDRNNADYGTAKYVETYHAQIKELLGGDYGEVFEMWFDGANGGDGYYGGAREKRRIPNGYYRFDEVFKFVRELQPKVCIFAGEHDTADFRWPGNERGDLSPDSRATVCTVGGYADGKYGNPDYGKFINTGCADGRFFKMCEADFPLRPGWFYHAKERGKSKHAAYLMNRYLVTVGNGGTMNIGIAPNKDGLLDEEDVKALRGFGELRKAFFANEVTDPAKPFNLVVLREDVSRGEQVDDWSFLVNDEKVLSGKSIGHKRIRILDRPMIARRGVRIVTDKGSVSYRLYFVNPELVKLVQSATTESGETDTAKWMTGAEKER